MNSVENIVRKEENAVITVLKAVRDKMCSHLQDGGRFTSRKVGVTFSHQ